MWGFVSEIIFFVLVTFGSIIALDYMFGTDKLKNIREALCTDRHAIILIAGAVVLIAGALHLWAIMLDSTTFKDLTTFYMSLAWTITWAYYTVLNVKEGIITLRNNSILKRQKPQ